MRRKFLTENVSVKKIQKVLHNPKQLKNKRRVLTVAVLVLMSVVILLGAIKIIDAT